MDSNYMPLPERISKQFSEVDSDIVMDLWKNSPPYKALKQQMEEMKKQNPFIMQLLEGKGAVNLTGEEHEILTAFFRLYMKADNGGNAGKLNYVPLPDLRQQFLWHRFLLFTPDQCQQQRERYLHLLRPAPGI